MGQRGSGPGPYQGEAAGFRHCPRQRPRLLPQGRSQGLHVACDNGPVPPRGNRGDLNAAHSSGPVLSHRGNAGVERLKQPRARAPGVGWENPSPNGLHVGSGAPLPAEQGLKCELQYLRYWLKRLAAHEEATPTLRGLRTTTP